MDQKTIKNCVGKEGFQRMNYLYQISNLAARTNPDKAASTFYSNFVTSIGKKILQRAEPSIKRTLCKKCNTFLIPGSTLRIRLKKSKAKHRYLRATCTKCGESKTYNTNRNHRLWIEKEEAIVEIIHYE